MLGLILAGLVAATPAPAPAPAVAPAEKRAEAVAKPARPKRVCIEEQQMGSLMTRSICATPEEWEKRRQSDAREIDRMRDNTGPCGTGAC